MALFIIVRNQYLIHKFEDILILWIIFSGVIFIEPICPSSNVNTSFTFFWSCLLLHPRNKEWTYVLNDDQKLLVSVLKSLILDYETKNIVLIIPELNTLPCTQHYAKNTAEYVSNSFESQRQFCT